MPIYKVVSQEYLDEYRENLEMLVNDFYNCVSFGSVMYFILRLSEYLQIGFYLKEYGSGENVKIARTTFKTHSGKEGSKTKFDVFTDEEGKSIARLKDYGDILRHENYSSDKVDMILLLATSEDIKLCVNKLSGGSALSDFFVSGKFNNVVTTLLKTNILNERLESILKDKLIMDKDSDTLENVLNSVINETGCSRDIVLRAMFNILKDEYVLGSKR